MQATDGDRIEEGGYTELRGTFALLLVLTCVGCSELRARQEAREGNRFYREGEYRTALEHYERAQSLAPHLAVVALNRGLSCRQLILPGSHSKDSEAATDCALDAFSRLQQLSPEDPRGRDLYIQTLFDADRFEALEKSYLAELDREPGDLLAINALIQVYSRWGKAEQMLSFTQKRADLHPKDADAQYAVGVLAFNQLFERGGDSAKAAFNPLAELEVGTLPPVFAPDDIVGQQRVALAELGIRYLEKALALRADYPAAASYLNLLYRQKAYGLFERPEAWRVAQDSALAWQKKASGNKPSDAAAGVPHESL